MICLNKNLVQMNPLTIQILAKNNEDTIEQAINSLLPLDAHIIIADLGSNDNTLQLCQKYPIISVPLNDNYSKVRNYISDKSETIWQMYICPWEVLLNGHENIIETINVASKKSYYLEILQGDVITKQIRLWRKDEKKFINPIFEKIVDENAEYVNAIVWSGKSPLEDEELINKWKKDNPFALDPCYYQAYTALNKKKYKEFIKLAEYYIFQNKEQNITKIMTHYYLGVVNCLVTDDQNSAIKNAAICISQHPLMAEFWCLLGDAYLKSNELEKAITFYENGKILGSYRLRSDRWPMQISKYDEYPTEMIENCKLLAKKHQVR